MLRRIILSNTNDHGSGNHGCGTLYQIQMILLAATMDVERGSLYRIRTIMVVKELDVEEDHSIEYK